MDKALLLRPLREEGLNAAGGLRLGREKNCADCAQSFTGARKRKRVVRAMLLTRSGEYRTWSWLLCRPCRLDAKRNGDNLPLRLKREAKREAVLMTAKPGGTA